MEKEKQYVQLVFLIQNKERASSPLRIAQRTKKSAKRTVNLPTETFNRSLSLCRDSLFGILSTFFKLK